MEDKTYRYPVALRWDQGPKELKKVKNKIHKYFQSPKESKGGDCEIPETNCSRGYILIYFKEEKDQKSVLLKTPHLIIFKDGTTFQDKNSLLLDVSLPDAVDMGGAVSSVFGSGDNKASGSSADEGQQQEDHQSSTKRGNSSMTDSDFKNGDHKRHHWKGHVDSTGHRESEKDEHDVGALEGEERDNNSSTPRSLSENEDESPEDSVNSRNESRRNLRPHLSKEYSTVKGKHSLALDDGASGSSVDKDHQQEDNQSSGNQQRKNSSLTVFGSMDGVPKIPEDSSTRQRDPEEYRSDHRIDRNEHDSNSSAPKPLKENGDYRSSGDSFTPGNEPRRNSLRGPMSIEEPARNHPASRPEPFISVTARLHKEWFTKAVQEEIEAKITSLSIEDKYDVVEVTGAYSEIESLYLYLQRRWEQEHRAEKPPDTPSDISTTDSPADQVCFPSALYEYIMEIYRAEIDKIERRYGVKIDHHSTPEGSTYVRFISQESGSSPEKAKEIFTDKVQKVMDDWSQVTVDPSVVPLTFSDIKVRVADRWSNTLVIQGENMDIILRGPKDELSQVKMFLEKADHKPARPPRDVTISTSNMKTEIEVDARHMDILKKLKHREISDIEKKYNVNLEEKSKKGSLLITFKSVNAAPDLSPHASHSFITLLQKTFFNIEKKEISVKPEIQEERVCIVQEQLMMAGIDIVMEYSKGTVLLIGHPVHVVLAEERLNGSQNPERGQAAAVSAEPMDTNSPPAATQKTEEPDKCPICLCEIEDKVILEKCKHAYCKGCLKRAMAHKPVCSICGVSYGTVTGDQPNGTMNWKTSNYPLPGYSGCGTIEIYYNIPGGTQKENHPHPGKSFSGTSRTAYLPDNKEGKDILRLLRKAFDQKLIFTVGESRTTGATDTVTWNDIHHKTSTYGGPQSFGYPDPNYLTRVRDELKAKGIE